MILAELNLRLAALLRARGLLPLRDRRILEVGCGHAYFLNAMHALGAPSRNLHGTDLLPERIEVARSRYPDMHFRIGNAEVLPYPDRGFDIVMFFTVFTSILDPGMRMNIAAEASRVLSSDGSILWYDFRYDNPANPHVRGMGRNEIRTIFPDYALDLETVTLLPPLARRLGPLTSTLYPLLVRIPFLRTHYLGSLRRRP
jgi:ubiquinone/menaquinone biosynthesis C-methylase UbiE